MCKWAIKGISHLAVLTDAALHSGFSLPLPVQAVGGSTASTDISALLVPIPSCSRDIGDKGVLKKMTLSKQVAWL